MFLNPLNPAEGRNPRNHLRFGHRGTIAALKGSSLGRSSIDVFCLKNEDLREDRQKAQERFRSTYFDAMREFDPESDQSKAQTLLDEYAAGKHPHSAAALDYYEILLIAQPKPVRSA